MFRSSHGLVIQRVSFEVAVFSLQMWLVGPQHDVLQKLMRRFAIDIARRKNPRNAVRAMPRL